MKMLLPFKIITFILLLSGGVYAQGTLRGLVSDSLSGDLLIGANVYLTGTSLGSATDFEGQYNIARIPEGTYKAKVSYIGYKVKEFDVIITNGKIVHQNIRLMPDVIEGEEVLVTGQAAGQMAAINQQRTSNTIINVVSEEKIKELPDANAAEAIGRLPGVSILRSGGEANKVILRGLSDKFTYVTIDGVKVPSTDATGRGIDLSAISQSSLSGIELFKALTPDKDADAIAGSINLVTKKAPVIRELRVEAKGGYNDVMESGKQYDFNARYAERYLDGLLGIQFTGNIENRIRSNERINLDYDRSIDNQTDYIINNFNLQFIDEIRKRNGASIILDLNTPDDGSLKLSGIYSNTKRDYLIYNREYPSGGGTGGTVTYSYRDREQEIKTFNTSLTGDNNLFDLRFQWGVSFAQSEADYPYDYQMDFLEPSNDGVSGVRNTPSIKDHPEVFIDAAYSNFDAATLHEAFYYTQKNYDREQTAFLNISRSYNLGDLFSGDLKIGGKYKYKTRLNDNSATFSPYNLGYWQPYEYLPDGTIRQKNFQGSYFEGFYNRYTQNPANTGISLSEFLDATPGVWNIYDKYKFSPLINRDMLRQWYELNRYGINRVGQQYEYNNDITARTSFYDIDERVAAGYIMNTLNIGQMFTFIAGVRVENEENDYISTYSPGQMSGFPFAVGLVRDTTASYSETIVLPNFHLNIKPADFLSIRLAAYKTLARPDFNYRLNTAYAWRGADVSANKEMYLGNPKLKTAKSWNFEINTSYFGNEIGLISFSAYYRSIEDMFHMLNQINTSGSTLIARFGLNPPSIHDGTYQLTVPYNSPKETKVWGFEFEHQMNFQFLPGYLKNIVLSYNASLVKSESWLIGTTTDTIVYYLPGIPFPFYDYKIRVIEYRQQLEEQPEFYGNISLGYDLGGFSGRLSLFHQSDYNLTFSPDGRSDVLVNAFTRLDLALKYKLFDYLTFVLNINNLTNVKEGNSINDRVNRYKILNLEERYGLTADIGVKVDL